ncbi:small multi-drug export protein [Paenibacillus provencensis]|uniref:Small multi-drug export protein n=1 Tax=Paenibacillus provencensis TaxID=441151 RepID=A0ABW3PLD1_9BACL|nr:small multi-drug export protein [Paenibacillus sp. MER 78]MCM3131090.1 small multi-drug export protein [Paenibacillus sp. MER 78]
MLEWAQNQSDLWQFIVIFIIAFAPWMDVSIVVPIGVVWGLPPIGVAITAFTGNFLLVLLLGLFFKQFYIWREKRRKEKGVTEPSKKEKKSKEIWEKYGIPGLALLAPLLVGTDIAAVLALTLGSSRFQVISWMTVSLAFWTAVFTIGSVYGFSFLNII